MKLFVLRRKAAFYPACLQSWKLSSSIFGEAYRNSRYLINVNKCISPLPPLAACECLLSFARSSLISSDVVLTAAECRQRSENKQVICWMLSDRPQKARPSQSSARPPLPAPRCQIMWLNKTVMSWDGGWDAPTFTADAWQPGQKQTQLFLLLLAQGFVCHFSG